MLNNLPNFFKQLLLLFVFITTSILFLCIKPVSQPLSYHLFADQRTLLGTPNFSNVISNIFFAIIGVMGFISCFSFKKAPRKILNFIFYTAIFSITFGSAYYHHQPNNQTLFWDRLPISIAMMTLLALFICDRLNAKLAKVIMGPAILFGIFAPCYWYFTMLHGAGDLRPYLFTQIFPGIFIPLLLLTYPEKDLDLWLAFIAYILARITESYDMHIYLLTNQVVSGHTLKHLFVALSVYLIYLHNSSNLLRKGSK